MMPEYSIIACFDAAEQNIQWGILGRVGSTLFVIDVGAVWTTSQKHQLEMKKIPLLQIDFSVKPEDYDFILQSFTQRLERGEEIVYQTVELPQKSLEDS